MATTSTIIVAFDTNSLQGAEVLAGKLDPGLCRAKIGKELFTACGPAVVEMLQRKGFEVFLDLKFHDIPNTVAGAVSAAAGLGVWMVNVHASGGERMLAAAREAVDKASTSTLLIAVTVLTSMAQSDFDALGIDRSIEQQVLELARLAQAQRMDGIVCSAREARSLREALGDKFLLVTPGIRMPDAQSDDQRRTCTPAEALRNGSDYLVIGRPITQASDPAKALREICDSLEIG